MLRSLRLLQLNLPFLFSKPHISHDIDMYLLQTAGPGPWCSLFSGASTTSEGLEGGDEGFLADFVGEGEE
ncbi:hypothetical protein E2P81_ATG09481 [Venturia nashicola]|nr:hypothetical protein E2P81_ATG09481 [Venturia nashicola]